MAADVTVSALSDYFVKRYNLANRDAEFKKNRVTLGLLNRDTERHKQGDGFYITVRQADAFSASPDFGKAMTGYSPGKTFRWLIGSPSVSYGRLTFDGLFLRQNGLGTIVDAKSVESDGIVNNMLDDLEFQIWANASASRGSTTIASGSTISSAGSTSFTLTNETDVYNFPIGLKFQLATANTGASPLGSAVFQVTSIVPQTSTVTASWVSGSSTTSSATTYYMVLYGQNNAATTYGGGAGLVSIPQIIPSADPSDSIYGVSRTDGNPALSGWRFSYRGSISETIQRSFAYMGRWVNRAASKFTVCLSMTDYMLLALEQQAQIVRDPTAMQKFGVEGMSVATPYGPITAIGVPQLGDGRGYIIDWTSWTLFTLGNLPHVIDDDGKVMQRLAPGTASDNLNGDGVEMRFRMWKSLVCTAPIANCTFPTT